MAALDLSAGQAMKASLTDIPGIRVGHSQDQEAITGCTVILTEAGAVAGMDIRGSASGSRETDPLHLMHIVSSIHGLLLTGGSAFGLGAASGVMSYLEEKGVGFQIGVAQVPIVPSAVIFDLKIGSHKVRPGPEMAYQACLNATDNSFTSGCIGVGLGATAGKYMGMEWAMKSGLGQAGIITDSGIVVAALVVANSYGDIIDPKTEQVLCGCRYPDGNPENLSGFFNLYSGEIPIQARGFTNTTLGIVATNVSLDKLLTTKMAQMAQDALGRVIRPAHTIFDGDIVFALSCGDRAADINWLGAMAAEVLAQAILDAAYESRSLGSFPACVRSR
ncbi:P1 family peptidase [candidate division CSSED10-310 bacterium]|uniref:P1 family peptidase n=1 Tax=candidate division CSSED10-310 bacterium TaxID=2855610 RepID=A0ABV6YV60_UNCC1